MELCNKTSQPSIVKIIGHIQKKVAHGDIAKIKKLHIFVLFENEAS